MKFYYFFGNSKNTEYSAGPKAEGRGGAYAVRKYFFGIRQNLQ